MIVAIAVRFWTMGLQASILIGVVLAVRFFLKKYPKIYSYALWALVGVRLLCPFWVESSFSLLPNLLSLDSQSTAQERISVLRDFSSQESVDIKKEQMGDFSEDKAIGQLQQDNIPVEKHSQVQADKEIVENTVNNQNSHENWKERFKSAIVWVKTKGILPLAVLYIFVAACLLAFYAIQYLRMKRKVLTAVRAHHNIWLSTAIASPFVMGIIAPKIYLPYWVYQGSSQSDLELPKQLTKEEYQYILVHEQMHIRHGDPMIRIVGIVCACLHWWNPLVWLAVAKMQEDMEMFCDETVVAHFTAQLQQTTLNNTDTKAVKKSQNNAIAKAYASALLVFAQQQNSFDTGLAFGKSYTEKRISNILHKRKKNWLIVGLVIALALFSAAAFMTVPKPQNVQSPAITEWIWDKENLPYLMEVCPHIPDFSGAEAMDAAFWEEYLFDTYTSDFDKESENIFSERYDFEVPYHKVSFQEVEETAEQIFGKRLSEYIADPTALGQENSNIFYREGYFYIAASDSPDFHYSLEGIEQVGIMTEVSLLKMIEDDQPVSHVQLNLYPAENTRGFRIGGKSEMQAEAEAQMSPFAYMGYRGFLDECTGWTGYNAFVNQDYDGDGVADRVLRIYQEESEYCQYQVVFGNGNVLELDKEVYDTGTPWVESADINGDGEQEIIFSQQYGFSTDMRGFSDLAIFEKKGNAYQRAELPFVEGNEGCSQKLTVHYQEEREQLITVSIEAADFKINVPIPNELWETERYQDYYKDVSETSAVWDYFLVKDGEETKLACKVHLFDKWSEYGLILLLGYENQRYVIEEIMPADDEFMDRLPDTRETWQLKEYRLSTKDILLANGEAAVLELWLQEGEYAVGEDVLPSAQTFEENFQGQYYLVTKNQEGIELDRHYLNQPNAAAAERDVFGDRCNFSGFFAIQEADYNGDHCPDFTIGVPLSSSMNFFVLYTVRENGKIELLCKEGIPALTNDFSVRFEMEQGSRDIFTYEYDNSIAEQRKLIYKWESEQGIYRSV